LSYLMGTLVLISLYDLMMKPDFKILLKTSLLFGLSLSVKFSAICFLPAFAALSLGAVLKKDLSMRQLAVAASVVFFLGSFKLFQNYFSGLSPLFHNMDSNPLDCLYQKESFTDFWTSWSFNPLKVLSEPYFHEHPPYSIGHLLFSSFWNDYYPNQSNFVWNRFHAPFVLARIELLLGMLLSGGVLYFMIYRGVVLLRGFCKSFQLSDEMKWFFIQISSLLTMIGMVVFLALRYDAWSCIQGRLIFPVFAIFLLLCGNAMEGLSRYPFISRMAKILFALFLFNSLGIILMESWAAYRMIF